jgi:glycosyltransferase involved in cell wall biosynthesis
MVPINNRLLDIIQWIIRETRQSISSFSQNDISIFHEFKTSPAGGGHQFLRALWKEFLKEGFRVEKNTISSTTRTCLFNSFNFNFEFLKKHRKPGCLMVHRVDGPISSYRGWDNGTDQRIKQINLDLADVTIFQSHFSMQKHLELGIELNNPVVILNAADPSIFHSRGRINFDQTRKIRLISTSWSDNPNKGAFTYKWLEENLNWDQFEYTFLGRTPIQFERIHTIPAVSSYRLAESLRNHDIFIIASINDPCSNALIEALSCGLPAIFLQSGGHPEIVKDAGFGFEEQNQIPNLLTKLVDEYEIRQNKISIPTINEVAHAYLNAMGLNKAS